MSLYRFDQFEFDSRTCKLSNNGREHTLEPKVCEVLTYFCQHPNQVVSRQQLIDAVWDGESISDNAISRMIGKIRKAFGETSRDSRRMLTVPREGYKLAASVSVQAESDVTDGGQVAASTAVDAPSQPLPLEPLPPVSFADQPVADDASPADGENVAANHAKSRLSAQKLALLSLVLAVLVSWLTWSPVVSEQDKPNNTATLSTIANNASAARLLADERTTLRLATDNTSNHLVVYAERSGTVTDTVAFANADIRTLAVSPDDHFVALWVDGDNCSIQQVMLNASATFTQPQRLVSCYATDKPQLQFGPEGRYLYYSGRRLSDGPRQVYRLNVITGATDALVQPLSAGPGNYAFDVSADGQSVLLLNGADDQTTRLYSLDLAENQYQLHVEFPFAVMAAIWSHDGQHFIYRDNEHRGRLWRARLDGAQATPVLNSEGHIMDVQRLPNGKDFILTSMPGGAGPMSVLRTHFPG